MDAQPPHPFNTRPSLAEALSSMMDMGFLKLECEQALAVCDSPDKPEDDIVAEAIQLLCAQRDTDTGQPAYEEEEAEGGGFEARSEDTFKMMLVLRRDLGMSVGKMVAQGAHAAVGSTGAAARSHREWHDRWLGSGAAKIAVGVESEDELLGLQAQAVSLDLPSCVVRDAGRTEVESGTVTALAIGPCPHRVVDPITRELKLL
ncbi:Peptidyl-tRNA hydrolase [Diplonema papillatum]|nr:Peptidyl-tRNA hydrolase [Diplonema papillatum]